MAFYLTSSLSPCYNQYVPRRYCLVRHHRLRHHCYHPNQNNTISSVSRLRRHHRRRLLKHHPTAEPSSSSQLRLLSDQNLQIILPVNRLPNPRALNYFNDAFQFSQLQLKAFVCAAEAAFEDLQTLVTVDFNTKGVVVSCRRSTVEFIGALIISSLVIVFIFKGLIKFFATNSYGSHYNGVLVYRRDRSLGGKEVVVGKVELDRNKNSNTIQSRSNSDTDKLMMTLDSGNEQKMRHRFKRKRRSERKLPKWWPVLSPGPKVMLDDREGYQRMANRLIRAILDSRMRGMDISADDIVQLRRICKISGVRVCFDTENSRDSLYRAAVDFVLNYCESDDYHAVVTDINGEDARNFIAGLAENIALEDIRAARMVTASVAARTRSRFLQAWALKMHGNHSEVTAELRKICLIHRIFPPDECSPEMEMVARGLEKQLKVDHRKFLFDSFLRVCGEDAQGSVAEALGLIQSLRVAAEAVESDEYVETEKD